MTNEKPSVLDRPDVLELVKSFNQLFAIEKHYREENSRDLYTDFTEKIMHDERWIKANNYIDYNSKYLRSIGPNKIDKKNLAKLIDAISADGKWHFNMGIFFGALGREEIEYAFERGKTDVSSLSPNMLENVNKSIFDKHTNSFNCDSVGCIAGFASAIALGWDSDIVKDINKVTNPNRAWEHIACNFLNIPLAIGEKIFFGERGSIWSFLKANDPSFDSVQYDDDTQYGVNEEAVDEYDYENISIDLLSIGYKKAVEMLSMILEEEIMFDEDFNPYFTGKHRKNNPNV